MAARNPTPRTDIARLIEKQMRIWELARAQRPEPEKAEPDRQVEDFVAISRMVGAGGHLIAAELSERLGWPVFDRELMQAMAGDDQVRARLYESLDERDRGWLEDSLRWALQDEFRKDDYAQRLSETILAVARQGHAIFLGRGADLVLPRERGLRVHLVAPQDVCVRRYAQRTNITEAAAKAEVERIQQERDDFLRRRFGPATDEPARHDMVLDAGRFTIEQVVELICAALKIRGVLR